MRRVIGVAGLRGHLGLGSLRFGVTGFWGHWDYGVTGDSLGSWGLPGNWALGVVVLSRVSGVWDHWGWSHWG